MRREVELAAKDPSNGATKGASTTRIKTERTEKAKRHRQLVKDVALLANLVRIMERSIDEAAGRPCNASLGVPGGRVAGTK